MKWTVEVLYSSFNTPATVGYNSLCENLFIPIILAHLDKRVQFTRQVLSFEYTHSLDVGGLALVIRTKY